MIFPASPEVVPDVRQRVREHLRLFGIDAAPAVELAVTEAVANAALHAYPDDQPGEIEIVISVAHNRVEAVIRDEGIGPQPNPQQQPGHYGVVLMEALADRFELEGAPGRGTTVRMEFVLPLARA